MSPKEISDRLDHLNESIELLKEVLSIGAADKTILYLQIGGLKNKVENFLAKIGETK